jgi:uncharacterized membrane protein HdeD (DUF308 family)
MTDTIVETEQSFDAKLFPWWLLLLWGLLTLLIGCAFLLTPLLTTELLIVFLGAYWLVGGIFALASLAIDRTHMGWKIFLAAINIIAGIALLAYPLFSTIFVLSFFIIFVGFWACFVGGVHLYQAFSKKDAGNGVLGVISLIFGALLLANPFIAAALLPFIAGIFAIVSGLCSIYFAFVAKKCLAGTPAA